MLENAQVPQLFRTHVRMPLPARDSGSSALKALKDSGHKQVTSSWVRPALDRVILVQASKTVREGALLTRRNSIGFHTNQFRHCTRLVVEGTHGDLMGKLSPAVAELLVESLNGP